MNRWADMLAHLNGDPVQPLPGPAGRVIVAHDEPLSADELADIDSPAELGRLLGISRQRAYQLIQQRAATARKEPT